MIFGANHERVCAALLAESISCWQGYEAMHHYELFQPHLSKLPVPSAFPQYSNFENLNVPQSEHACQQEAGFYLIGTP